jgi:imidazolonepropionase-like amidohydrolase/ABC-type multidrug transport system permease subunit
VKPYLSMIRINLRLTMRDRTVLFFNYVFPLIFFFIFGSLMHAERGGAVVQVVNMVLSLGILASGLFGAGMRTVMDREQNILRRFKVAPISPAPILVGQLVTGVVHYIPVTFLVLVLARVIYGMPPLEHPLSLYAYVLLGLLAFRGIGSIVGAIANSMQESQIIVQLLYFPMLFLGGATFPIGIMPNWLQVVAQFIPSTYLSTGLTAILAGHETFFNNLAGAAALAVTAVVGTFLAMKLFRWEKEEKMRASAKLWLVAVLAPFLLMGSWQVYAKNNVVKGRVLVRELSRSDTALIRDARLFLGDGTVIEQGSVLVKNGKIAEVYTGPAPDAKSLKADPVDAAGKTLLPGLIDVHVHLGSPGGFWEDSKDWANQEQFIFRELAAYLYSGVTAVKSVGDETDVMLKDRAELRAGEKEGAELFTVGPMFTAPGGHGTEYAQFVPKAAQAEFEAQMVRLPKSPEEARQQVDELKKLGVDGIKAILEGGVPGHAVPRLDPALLRAIAAEARADNLPIVCHTGDAHDVGDALEAGVNGIEHGSMRDAIPQALFERMKQTGTSYDPTLAVWEAIIATIEQKTDPLDRSLVQQVGPPRLLVATKKAIVSPQLEGMRAAFRGRPLTLDFAKQNLMAALASGVTLVTGTDSGNPQMIHGPGIHRELQLWVEAGVPPAIALQAATYNAARLLRAGDRIGLIKKGYEASLLLVDGNPLKDISATEHISAVFFKGEHVDRKDLFEER